MEMNCPCVDCERAEIERLHDILNDRKNWKYILTHTSPRSNELRKSILKKVRLLDIGLYPCCIALRISDEGLTYLRYHSVEECLQVNLWGKSVLFTYDHGLYLVRNGDDIYHILSVSKDVQAWLMENTYYPKYDSEVFNEYVLMQSILRKGEFIEISDELW